MRVYDISIQGNIAKMARLFFLCVLQLVLNSANSAHSQGTSPIDDMIARYERCEDVLFNSSKFAPIYPKLNSLDKPTMAMLTDNTLATPNQIELLTEFYDRRQPCMQRMLEDAGHIHPALVTVIADSNSSADDTYLQLVRRQITWGQYAEKKRERVLRYQRNFAHTVQDIQSNLAETNAHLLQQRQSASDALIKFGAYQLQLLNQQNSLNPVNRPQMTQCRYVGAILQCFTM